MRKVSNKNKSKFEHLISIPVDIVRKLELSECIVELKIKEDYFIVKKIGEKLDGDNHIKDDPYTTIHY